MPTPAESATYMPRLESERLLIRPLELTDLGAVHQLLDIDIPAAEPDSGTSATREERLRWLQWSVSSCDELALLHQPPTGDRAMVLRRTGIIVGICGFALCLNPYGQLSAELSANFAAPMGLTSTEIGMYWAVSPSHRRRGFATEAARILVDYAFARLNLKRIVATTTFDNVASIGVMAKLGMRIERNRLPIPPWFQVVGFLDHPSLRTVSVA